MRKIILLIMVLILFCGCASKNVTISQRSSLYDYEGEWIISKLIAPPKVSLTAYGYAMENSHIIGEKVTIKNNKVIFKGEASYYDKEIKGDFEDFRLLPYYDSDIVKITGGDYPITDIDLKDENGKGVAFGLFKRQDGKLLLLAGEKYVYEGFYLLIKEEKRLDYINNKTYKEKQPLHIKYKGEYEIGKLKVPSVPDKIKGEEAKAKTVIPGGKIKVNEYTIEYDGDIFYIDSEETFDKNDVITYFFTNLSDAEYLCGKEDQKRFGGDIRFIRYSTSDYKKRLAIVIKDNNDIMLWLGDMYKFVGFYELI